MARDFDLPIAEIPVASALPADIRIETVEMHTAGEPVRIVIAGYPEIKGATLLEKRRYARDHLDAYRRFIMFEPRGHADMYGVLPVAPDHPDADLAVLFIHNEGYSTMCGHATIALGRFAAERGVGRVADGVALLNLQCPCGLVQVRTALDHVGRAGAASFLSVPAFAFALDRAIVVPEFGAIHVDVGYGGAFYAFVPAARFGLDVRRSPLAALVHAADLVTKAAAAQIPLHHPQDPDLAFFYGAILTDGGLGETAQTPSANLCVFAAREVDRSPTGSGVTARIALQTARGLLGPGEMRFFESVTGGVFKARAVERLRHGSFDAVTVEVFGHAYYTGGNVFTLEADDPLSGGFLLR